MHELLDSIRKELNIPRYDIDDDTSLSMTKDTETFQQNGMDDTLEKYMSPDFKPSKVRNYDTLDNDTGMSGTLETSIKSRASKVSTEQSTDSYPFKSTEDEELYSTIRSDMNNTKNLSDTQALKTYQMSINEQEELEQGEVEASAEEGEVTIKEDGEVNIRAVSTADNSTRVTEDEEEDDIYDDDYEDDGDDEDEDGHHTTEPTATYRTDDDDF